MKTYELMESISAVDEEMLLECETAKYARRPTVYKILLVAAIIALLSITAFGTSRLFAKVHEGKIVPHTFHVESLVAQWNVTYKEECKGYILTAEIDTYEGVSLKQSKLRNQLKKGAKSQAVKNAAFWKY